MYVAVSYSYARLYLECTQVSNVYLPSHVTTNDGWECVWTSTYRHLASSLHQSPKRYKTQEICCSSPQLLGRLSTHHREELGRFCLRFGTLSVKFTVAI